MLDYWLYISRSIHQEYLIVVEIRCCLQALTPPSIPISFGPPAATEPHPGLPHTPIAIVPLQLGLTQLSPTPADNAVQPSVDAAASEQGTNRESIRALQDQVS